MNRIRGFRNDSLILGPRSHDESHLPKKVHRRNIPELRNGDSNRSTDYGSGKDRSGSNKETMYNSYKDRNNGIRKPFWLSTSG